MQVLLFASFVFRFCHYFLLSDLTSKRLECLIKLHISVFLHIHFLIAWGTNLVLDMAEYCLDKEDFRAYSEVSVAHPSYYSCNSFASMEIPLELYLKSNES